MSFLDSRRIGWDTETTSPDPTQARIVTAALAGRGGRSPDRTQSWLIATDVEIPEQATAVHGITNERAQAEGAAPAAALEEIAETLHRAIRYGMPIVAFNQSFDWSVLHHELRRNGLPTIEDRLDGQPPATLVDPLVIDKQCDRYRRGSRRLQVVAGHYGVTLADWHTADADALAALLIAEEQYRRYPQLADLDATQLYAAQRAWRAEQAASLQEYFRRKDPAAVVDGAWPLIPGQRGA